MLNIGENTGYLSNAILGAVNGIDSALDKAPDILDKLKALFGSKKKTADSKKAAEPSDSGEAESAQVE